MLNVKGSVLRSRLAFVEEKAGKEGVERVLASLPEEDRRTLTSLLATGWYPFALGVRLDEAVVREIGGGSSRFFERLGAASAEKNLTTVHKSFLVPDVHAFLAKAPVIYSFYYDQGRREYRQTGPREAVLTTHDAEAFSAADCLTVVGWYRRALEMCGAAGVRVIEEECRAKGGDVCRYRVSWQ
jgi:uncharacterized protein (TIGR02265 family)